MSRKIWEAVRSPHGPNKRPQKELQMKRSNLLQLVTVSLLLAFSVVGCKKTPKGVTTIPGRPNDVPSSTGANPPIRGSGGPINDNVRPINPGPDPNANLVTP